MNKIHNEQRARKALDDHIKAIKALKFVVWIVSVVVACIVVMFPLP